MKRSVLILFVLLLAMAVTASAQIKFGLKAGVNLADMSGDGWDVLATLEDVTIDHKFSLGFGGGFFAQIPIGQSGLLLQPEALFVMKGSKVETSGTVVTEKAKLNYIEVPVLVKYSIPMQGKVSPNLFAGPYAAFNVGAKLTFDNVPADETEDWVDMDIDNIKPIDFGITFGGGLDYAIGPKGKLTFDIRYTMGLVDAFDDVTEAEDDALAADKVNMVDDAYKGLKLKNSDIRFMVGYAF